VEHLLTRLGRRRVLIVDVCSSPDGHGVGYGIMLKRIERALRFGAVMKVLVFYVREAASINSAVFQLRSPDVEILRGWGWTALWLRGVWMLSSPFRLGLPRLWMRHVLARTLLGSVYGTAERSRYVPGPVRRFILRPRASYRSLKRANNEYAKRFSSAWKRTFAQASRRLRSAEQAGTEIPLRLSLPPERERDAIEQAARLGIGPADRLVTVHVRESGYRSTAGLRQRPLDLLRNARIETFLDAFDALVDRGYRVVRVGDPTMTPVTRRGVVDLATSPLRTEWLETWCIQRSAFLIGCDSGPSWLAFLLNVPVLTVNALHLRDIQRPCDRFICKLVREGSTGRLLSVSEMLTEDYLRQGLDTTRYEHLDNEPSDLRDAAIDMIAAVGGDELPSPAQQRFNQRLVELGRQAPHDWSALRGIAFIREPRGRISRRFAERWWSPGPGDGRLDPTPPLH
jgi:putative glycosyltransferase (TIGR04372 family)